MINTYTDFGFMDAELGNSVDVLLLVRRDSDNPLKPKHHLITSDGNNVERDSSKLFIYNAVWNRAQNEDTGNTCTHTHTHTHTHFESYNVLL